MGLLVFNDENELGLIVIQWRPILSFKTFGYMTYIRLQLL